jgi:hypothetical protein
MTSFLAFRVKVALPDLTWTPVATLSWLNRIRSAIVWSKMARLLRPNTGRRYALSAEDRVPLVWLTADMCQDDPFREPSTKVFVVCIPADASITASHVVQLNE